MAHRTRVGVISDTHGLVRASALEALAGSDLIVHAGDVGKPEVLAQLSTVAPVVAVRGNVDRGPWAEALPENEVVDLASGPSSSAAFDRPRDPLAALRSPRRSDGYASVARLASGPRERSRCTPRPTERVGSVAPSSWDRTPAPTFLYVLHDLSRLDLDPVAGGFGVVISGHSHQPRCQERDGVLYLNPGSAGPRRFKLPISLARLEVGGGHCEAELLALAP